MDTGNINYLRIEKGGDPMTELEITYIFIRYITIAIERKAKEFYHKYNKILFHENQELIENIDSVKEKTENDWNSMSCFYGNIEEKITFQELIFEGLNSLDFFEKQIIREKFLNERSDMDIGKNFSVSSQMISKKKRKILNKLKSIYYA